MVLGNFAKHLNNTFMNARPTLNCILVSFAMFLCFQLSAQEDNKLIIQKDPQLPSTPITLDTVISDYKGNLVSRPAQHVGSFESIIVDFTVDGYEGQHHALKGPVLSLKGSVPHDWQQDPSLSSRYGIALRNRYATDIIMGFTVFRRANFIQSTSNQDVISFLAGLKNIYRDRLILNEMPGDFRDQGFMSHLLGLETILVDYSIASRKGESETIRHYAYYAQFEEYWIEITVFGPQDKLANFLPPYKRFLRNLSIVQNEEEAFGLVQ